MGETKRPEYIVRLDKSVSRKYAHLVFGVLTEIEDYIVNRNFNGFWMRTGRHKESAKVENFGWNPYFIPNTDKNKLLAKIVLNAVRLTIDAIEDNGKMFVSVHVINRGDKKSSNFAWSYHINDKKGIFKLHFERETKSQIMCKGPSR